MGNDFKDNKAEIEVLVKLAQKADTDAFSKLYDIFIDPVYRYVYFRVKDLDAEDIVETIFLKVWESIRQYKHKKNSSFSSWIFKIAHNMVIDYYRSLKNKDVQSLDETIVDDTRHHNPLNNINLVIDNENLKIALSNIKKSYRDIIIYKFINELSNAEIAEILEKSEGSLRILQFRALNALKKELTDMGVNYDF